MYIELKSYRKIFVSVVTRKYLEELLILPAEQLNDEKDLILQVNFLKFVSII